MINWFEVIRNLSPILALGVIIGLLLLNRNLKQNRNLKRKNKKHIGRVTLKDKVNQSTNNIHEKLKKEMNEDTQKEAAQLLSLLSILNSPEDSHYVNMIEIAIEGLVTEKPNLIFAEEVRQKITRDIESKTRANSIINPVRFITRSKSPSIRIVFGMGVLLYFAIPLIIIYNPWSQMPAKVLDIPTGLLLMVAFFGSVGSIVSIMVRIQDFSKVSEVDDAVLFFTGFFKPIVGAAFALFIFGVLKAGIIPVTIKQETESYFFMALSFLAGFSERFAKDVASTAESQISSISSIDQLPSKVSKGKSE